MSKKAIKVAAWITSIGATKYKVLSVKNSIEFHPGELLSKPDLERLCISNHWDVTVVPNTGAA